MKNATVLFILLLLSVACNRGHDTVHISDCYLALFWNEMRQKRYDSGKKYLDSVAYFTGLPPDDYFKVLSARAIYYDIRGDYEKELEAEKSKRALLPRLKGSPKKSKYDYTLSNAFLHNNLLDSVLYYALQAVTHIADSADKFNYLLYENVAEIAERRQDFPMAIEYRKKAFNSYEKSIDSRLNTRLWELQKKYDVAEFEIKTGKAQKPVILTVGVAFLLLLAVLAVNYHRNKQRRIALLEKKNVENRLRWTQQRAEENKRMVQISLHYLTLHSAVQQDLLAFANKIRSKDRDLADQYELLLKNSRIHFKHITEDLFTDELLGEVLKNHRGLELFNNSDRVLLFMLAAGVSNEHIAALLNTTPVNLKSKKSYLKKKIESHIHQFDHPDTLLALF